MFNDFFGIDILEAIVITVSVRAIAVFAFIIKEDMKK